MFVYHLIIRKNDKSDEGFVSYMGNLTLLLLAYNIN